ncbi:MAG: VanW family protein [Anaerolineae bacterium]|jgi:vancomycin resistance protein YoaR
MTTIRWIVALLFGLTLLTAGLFSLALGVEAWHADRIYPGVRVWGADVGSMRLDEAADLLEQQLAPAEDLTLTLNGPDRSRDVPLSSLGVTLVPEATAQAAFEVGRQADEGLLNHLALLLSGREVPPVLCLDEVMLRVYVEALADEVNRPPEDARLTWEANVPTAHPPRPGQALDVEATLVAVQRALTDPSAGAVDLVVHELPPQVVDAEAAQAHLTALLSQPFTLVLSNPREQDPGPWSIPPEDFISMLAVHTVDGQLQVVMDEPITRAYLESLAQSLAVEPVNARFHFDEATGELVPIASGADGRALDVEASLANVRAAVSAGRHVAPLVLQIVPPPYPETATASELGIDGLVAEGDSYFIGSPSGRDHNIRLAAAQFDGLIIAPGETFSFNRYLGEVSAEAGYDESYITAGEQLAIEVGGGICQVSTTAFRAALWGGYPIDERWYHHHRVGYYELRGYGPGFDATVYTPVVDFQFTNDRDAPLLIETEIGETEHRLVFRFYSVDDGRQVEVEGPEIGEEIEPGPPIYQLDESLEPGTVIEWQSASKGLSVTVQRWVYDAQEDLIHRDTFVSEYDARRAAYHYGPGYEPPEETDPAE